MDLDELRREIDEADQTIIAALKRRAKAAQAIGEAKAEAGKPAFAPGREAKVFRRLAEADSDPLPTGALTAIYTEVISACLALEQPLRVAYLGPEHTFSHLAVLARFGQAVCPVPQTSFADALAAIEKGEADLAMLPVENSTQGPVGETFDCVVETHLPVVGEYYLPVQHHLVGDCEMADIEVVYSHPQPLAQCRKWLATNLGDAQLVPASSSATAAAQAAASSNAAAVAPERAGEVNGLRVLAANIQDDAANRTRFWIVGGDAPGPTGKDKTSLVLTTPHRSGALHEALKPFRGFGLNMTMIQSRPARGRGWEYLFFIDFQGHQADAECAKTLAALRDLCPLLEVLGSYPEAG